MASVADPSVIAGRLISETGKRTGALERAAAEMRRAEVNGDDDASSQWRRVWQILMDPDTNPTRLAFLADVVDGLSATPKTLPPKWFYDAEGALLFEDICETPEYYPTRTETAILTDAAPDIARYLGDGVSLVEFGSGSMTKVRLVLDRLRMPKAFVAIDMSAAQLGDAALALEADYPGLSVHAVAEDFTTQVQLPESLDVANERRCAFFPGSTIGNFDPPVARRLLSSMRDIVGPDGALLIGFDLQKEPARLEAAYNDAAGLTAQFNKNILARINRELDGDVNLDRFEHWAPYNAEQSRIEMHLRSVSAQTLRVAGYTFTLREGETIHTENSYKYSVSGFRLLAGSGGFVPIETWTDTDELFAVMLLRAA